MTSSNSDRLAEIVGELGRKASYAFGDRRLGDGVTTAESVAIVEALSEETDEGVKERRRLAEREGLKIHCHAGCNTCCNVVVMVYEPEALRIAALLRKPESAEALAYFQSDYARWKKGLADVLPELEARSADHRNQAPYFDLLIEATRRRVMCAFNRDGNCTVYQARPLGCRYAHALDTDASCAHDHPEGKKASALAFKPLDTLMVSASRLIRAVHNSMDAATRHRAEALCQAVARILGIDNSAVP